LIGFAAALLRASLTASFFLLLATPAQTAPRQQPPAARQPPAPQVEKALSQVFEAIEQNKFDLALERIEALIAANPNFRLAHLIRGDLLLARTRPITTFGNAGNVPKEKIEDLRAEALSRLHAMRERPAADRLPRNLLQFRPEQTHALVVDSSRSRLYVFENDHGRPRFVSDYYVTLGKRGIDKMREGDQKTPIGVYHVTANLPRNKLADLYGSGAFPINYPNEWDKRRGRNGHGIWLHGTPSDTYARPPRASDGCIVLSNIDLEFLSAELQVGLTPVIIADELQWVDTATQEEERMSLTSAIEAWRMDWESLDTEKYLRHYSARFQSADQNFAQWAGHKRKVNAGKEWVKVGLTGTSMFRNPGKDDFVVVSFEQDYRSSNLSNSMRKRQYWVREGARWKIIYEGSA
jgi:murein L,D-transpeptidase YafK